MRIRTLLITAFVGALVIALGLIGMIGVLDYRYQRYAHAQETAQGVLRETSALLVLTHEYALHAEDRPVQQWRSRFANIVQGLQQGTATDEEAPSIALEHTNAIAATFTQLVTLRGNPSTEMSQRRANLLFDQLLTQSQALFDTLQRWDDDALAKRRSTEALTQRLVYVIPALILVVLGLLTTLLFRRVVQPLSRLHASVLAVSQGDLSMRSTITHKDEIGEVAQTFNQLAIDLVTQLKNREAFLQQIFDTSSVAILLVDTQGRISHANNRTAEMFGWPMADLLGREYVELIHPSERDAGRQRIQALLASELSTVDMERLYLRADGSEFWGHLTGRPLETASGEKQGLVGVINDIHTRKVAEGRMQLAASVFSHSREGILITDAQGTIVEVNEAFTRITGYNREEAVGNNPRMLKSGRHNADFYEAMWRDISANGYWSGEVWDKRKDGTLFAEILGINAVKDAQGKVLHFVALFTDITAMKQYQEQLERSAHFDSLTGLPNRVLLADRLLQAMRQAQRGQKLLAVCYLDLDGFKQVNDHYGHGVGDELLITLAQKMKGVLREGDSLARMGGDEFVVVLADLDNLQVCQPVLERLLQSASAPVHIGSHEVQVSASIGVTLYPKDKADAEQLIRHADQAMYEAKQSGKNRICFFDQASTGATSPDSSPEASRAT